MLDMPYVETLELLSVEFNIIEPSQNRQNNEQTPQDKSRQKI